MTLIESSFYALMSLNDLTALIAGRITTHRPDGTLVEESKKVAADHLILSRTTYYLMIIQIQFGDHWIQMVRRHKKQKEVDS